MWIWENILDRVSPEPGLTHTGFDTHHLKKKQKLEATNNAHMTVQVMGILR